MSDRVDSSPAAEPSLVPSDRVAAESVQLIPAGGAKGDQRQRGLWHDALRETFRKTSARIGLALLSIILVFAIFAPLLAPHDPVEPLEVNGKVAKSIPPCVHLFGCAASKTQYIMGTDKNGRDVFSRVVFGSRISLLAGAAAVVFALVIGVVLGLVAGYFGRWIDNVIMRCMDVLLAFPSLLLAIAIVTVLGRGLLNAIIAISIVTIPVYARVVRASVLSIKEQEYVTADRALGVRVPRLLVHRILPNALTPLVVQATLGFATAVLDIAGLSFLGLGVQPPKSEWGSMISLARDVVFTSPHQVFFPGLMILLNVLAFNLIGDGLRDALDPRLNR
jgi:ABC-type dipeptide/oligopeptide/nickel transport system permease subunit